MGEIFVCNPITLNTQPTDGKWRININTGTITVFAIPGEGIDLDASKFESALEGYEVQKLDDGSLAMIKITEQQNCYHKGDREVAFLLYIKVFRFPLSVFRLFSYLCRSESEKLGK